MLELQLVFLGFCRACRSVPALAVYVDDQTPRSYGLLASFGLAWDIPSAKRLILGRVPIVMAICVTGALSVEVLVRGVWAQHAAVELWASLELLDLRGSAC